MCSQMLMHAIAQGGFTDTVRKSALKVDSGRKIPWRTGEWNLRQRRATELAYIPTQRRQVKDSELLSLFV